MQELQEHLDETPGQPVTQPRLLVYSSLFPSPADPNAGIFIRERMFRVAQHFPLVVVSPKAWSPFDWLIRKFKPRFRPLAPQKEEQRGITVYAPRFLSLPGVLKSWDSTFMALGSYLVVRKLKQEFGINIIDAHFGYPDGHAASLLATWFHLPFTVTLRGSEKTYIEKPAFRRRITTSLKAAAKVIGVSDSLRRLAVSTGVSDENTVAICNAVDCHRFHPVDRAEARKRFGLNETDSVIITVGWLIERKGFHRVIGVLPDLIARSYPTLAVTTPSSLSEFKSLSQSGKGSKEGCLHYLIVGGAPGTENMEEQLKQQVSDLSLQNYVHFLGPMKPDELKWALSAADLFILSTSREGWANVFLESMACALPVITTDVDGNREVVCRPELGELVKFGDNDALADAIKRSLNKTWNKAAIRAYAEENSWDKRIETLCKLFQQITENNVKN